jgi:hypothetical protein
MSAKANQAVCSLYHQTVYDIREFVNNQKKMEKLEDSYFRYAECLQVDLRLRERLRRRYGLMGVHFPSEFVTEETAKKLSPLDKTSSGEVRKDFKLWEFLEDFLSVAGEATYSQFSSFLYHLSFPEPSSQSVASAIRTHPELFEERTEGGDRFIKLRSVERYET